jgi:hypothetical protein
MLIYSFRPYDYAYTGTQEVPDGTTAIPPYNTFDAPPEQEGYWPFMDVTTGWVLELGGLPPEPPPAPPDYSAQNKQNADTILNATDWTAIPSVADPAQSDPYLMNQNEFLVYRSNVRAVAVNPPADVLVNFPSAPSEQWSPTLASPAEIEAGLEANSGNTDIGVSSV